MLDATHCIKCCVKTIPLRSKLQVSQGTKHSERTRMYSLNSCCTQPPQTRHLCLYKGWQSKHRTHREALIKHSGLGKWILIEWRKKKKQNVFTWEPAFICSGSLKSGGNPCCGFLIDLKGFYKYRSSGAPEYKRAHSSIWAFKEYLWLLLNKKDNSWNRKQRASAPWMPRPCSCEMATHAPLGDGLCCNL